MDEDQKTFYDAGRPTWGPAETLVLPRPLAPEHARRAVSQTSDLLTFQRSSIQSERQEVRLATFSTEVCATRLG